MNLLFLESDMMPVVNSTYSQQLLLHTSKLYELHNAHPLYNPSLAIILAKFLINALCSHQFIGKMNEVFWYIIITAFLAHHISICCINIKLYLLTIPIHKVTLTSYNQVKSWFTTRIHICNLWMPATHRLYRAYRKQDLTARLPQTCSLDEKMN